MTAEEINEVSKRQPEKFAVKCAAGLNREQAARVILAQEEHDRQNPPHVPLIQRANKAAELSNVALRHLKTRYADALRAREDVPDEFGGQLVALEDPGAPCVTQDLEGDGSVSVAEIQAQVVTLQAQHDGAVKALELLKMTQDEVMARNAEIGTQLKAAQDRVEALEDGLRLIVGAKKLKEAQDLATVALDPSAKLTHAPAGDAAKPHAAA